MSNAPNETNQSAQPNADATPQGAPAGASLPAPNPPAQPDTLPEPIKPIVLSSVVVKEGQNGGNSGQSTINVRETKSD